MTITRHRDIEWLETHVGSNAKLKLLWMQLQRTASLIESECPDAVSWVVAYGPLVERIESGSVSRLAPGSLKVLTAATSHNFFDTTMMLADKVFGPALTEFGLYMELDVWTPSQLTHASKAGGQFWNRLIGGIWLHGSPDVE